MTSVLRQFLKISISLRKSVQKIIIIHDYQERNVSLSFTRNGVSIWNSIPLSVKTLNISNFRQK